MRSDQPAVGVSSVSLHILIVGAGLSGLAAAIGLRQAGHEVTVLEQTPELREVGAGIQLPANSSRVLQDLGILDEVKKYAVEPHDLVIRSYHGEELYKQNLYPSIYERFQYPHLLIHRADLRRVFYEKACAKGATINLGACVKSIDFEGSKVEVVTGDQYTADLILGADGEHSICRESLLGYSDPPRSSGDTVFRLAIPSSKILSDLSVAQLIDPPCVHAWYGPNSHAVCYQLLKDGIFNIVLTLPEDEGAVAIGPQPADLDFVRHSCRDWDPRFQQLLHLADNALKWTLLQTDELKTWIHPRGQFALLGDSAHATLPYLAQGAALSLESAHILSTLLQHVSSRSEIPGILSLYENMRIPRARRTRERSRQMHDICQLVDGPAQKERDRVFREEQPGEGFPNPWADPGFQQWMWAFDARATAQRVWEHYSETEKTEKAQDKTDNPRRNETVKKRTSFKL